MKITVRLLKSKGACLGQLSKFKELFPNGVTPTKELCLTYAKDFDWYWAAEKLLSGEGFVAYNEAKAIAWKAYEEAKASARKAYEEAKAPTWKAYKETTAPTWKAYKEATASVRKAYEEAKAIAKEAYKEAEATARKAYCEALAIAWFDIWQKEKPER